MPAKPIVQIIKSGNLLGTLLKDLSIRLMDRSARSRLELFKDNIKGKKILDVGVGTGSMSKILREEGYKVGGVDIDNSSLFSEIKPTIYDGENIPLKDDSQDTGILVCVLHHCANPIKVLEETMRVCKRIIIIEDTYRNNFERWLVAARDSVGNFEFYRHEYHSTKEWLKIFRARGWKSVRIKEWSSIAFYGMYGRQSLYVIEKTNEK